MPKEKSDAKNKKLERKKQPKIGSKGKNMKKRSGSTKKSIQRSKNVVSDKNRQAIKDSKTKKQSDKG